jgi:hypothetical protein
MGDCYWSLTLWERLKGRGRGFPRTFDSNLAGDKEGSEEDSDEGIAMRRAQKREGNSYVLMQVNCWSTLDKFSDFFNSIKTYNRDVVIGTESRLRQQIRNAEIFTYDYATSR